MDEDLDALTREQLLEEVKRLRAGIRAHRDSSEHELCWHRSIHGSPSPPGPSSCGAASATGNRWTSSSRMRSGPPTSSTSSSSQLLCGAP